MIMHKATAASLFCALSAGITTVSASSHHVDPERTIIRAPIKDIPAYPDFRFVAWDELTAEVRDHAHAVGYQGKTWNKPGQLDIESKDWESLTDDTRSQLTAMGFSAPQWDCYMNHYRSYEWDELEDEAANLQLRAPLMLLGWTHESWDNDETPDLEDKYWADLSVEQVEAAASLCYTQTVWDEVAIPLWIHDDGTGSSDHDEEIAEGATDDEVVEEKTDIYETLYDPNDRNTFDGPTGPSSAHNSRDIPIPMFRFDPWDELTPEMKALAKKAHYNEKNWNTLNSKNDENRDFETIGKSHPGTVKALKEMGFTEDQWDCYMSHYSTYEWDELKVAGVQGHYRNLGYTHKMWDEDDKPDVMGRYWPDLTDTQQNAAYELCYFRETWDEVSLQFWPRTSSNTDWKAYALAHPAQSGAATMVVVTLLVGLVFAVACCCRGNCRMARGSSEKDNDLEMFGQDAIGGGYRDDEDDEEYGEEPRVV